MRVSSGSKEWGGVDSNHRPADYEFCKVPSKQQSLWSAKGGVCAGQGSHRTLLGTPVVSRDSGRSVQSVLAGRGQEWPPPEAANFAARLEQSPAPIKAGPDRR